MSDAIRTANDRRATAPGMAGAVVQNTAMFALSLGVSHEVLCAATGLQPSDWMQRDARLPNDTVARIWALLNTRFRCFDGTRR